jgi:hypothetical protein
MLHLTAKNLGTLLCSSGGLGGIEVICRLKKQSEISGHLWSFMLNCFVRHLYLFLHKTLTH